MYKPIDQTSDAGYSTLRLVVERFPKVFEFAKTANLKEDEFSSLPSEAFADSAVRRYPIHTPEQTAISIGYAKLANALPQYVIENLRKAADLHGIDNALFTEDSTKVAQDNTENYLLPEKKRFKITGAQDVKTAESLYIEKYAQLSIEDRSEMGMRLVKYAEEHHVSLQPSTQKLAGFTMTSTQIFKDWVEARREASLKLGSAMSPAFAELANNFKGVEPFISDRRDQLKLASLVYSLDKQAGLTKYYGRKLPDPLQTVFNTDLQSKNFTKIGTSLHNVQVLKSLPLTFWQDALGDDIAAEIAPDGELDPDLLEQVLPTLPNDLKTALDAQLSVYHA